MKKFLFLLLAISVNSFAQPYVNENNQMQQPLYQGHRYSSKTPLNNGEAPEEVLQSNKKGGYVTPLPDPGFGSYLADWPILIGGKKSIEGLSRAEKVLFSFDERSRKFPYLNSESYSSKLNEFLEIAYESGGRIPSLQDGPDYNYFNLLRDSSLLLEQLDSRRKDFRNDADRALFDTAIDKLLKMRIALLQWREEKTADDAEQYKKGVDNHTLIAAKNLFDTALSGVDAAIDALPLAHYKQSEVLNSRVTSYKNSRNHVRAKSANTP